MHPKPTTAQSCSHGYRGNKDGKMEVQMPYFIVNGEVEQSLSELVNDSILDFIASDHAQKLTSN